MLNLKNNEFSLKLDGEAGIGTKRTIESIINSNSIANQPSIFITKSDGCFNFHSQSSRMLFHQNMLGFFNLHFHPKEKPKVITFPGNYLLKNQEIAGEILSDDGR